MPWREIAESAYEAFCHNLGPMYFGLPCLTDWSEMPTHMQIAWEAAVRQAGACAEVPLGGEAPDESRWSVWKPPGVIDRKRD